jgi:hypothetical protein
MSKAELVAGDENTGGCGCSGCVSGTGGCIQYLLILGAISMVLIAVAAAGPAVIALGIFVAVLIPPLIRRLPVRILLLTLTLATLLMIVGPILQSAYAESQVKSCKSWSELTRSQRSSNACITDPENEKYRLIPILNLAVGVPSLVAAWAVVLIQIKRKKVGTQPSDASDDSPFWIAWRLDEGIGNILGSRHRNPEDAQSPEVTKTEVRSITRVPIAQIQSGDQIRLLKDGPIVTVREIVDAGKDLFRINLSDGDSATRSVHSEVDLVGDPTSIGSEPASAPPVDRSDSPKRISPSEDPDNRIPGWKNVGDHQRFWDGEKWTSMTRESENGDK